MGEVEAEDGPDFVVCNRLGTLACAPRSGTAEGACATCKAKVHMAPSTVAALARWPGVRTLCIECAMELLPPEGCEAGFAPGAGAELAEAGLPPETEGARFMVEKGPDGTPRFRPGTDQDRKNQQAGTPVQVGAPARVQTDPDPLENPPHGSDPAMPEHQRLHSDAPPVANSLDLAEVLGRIIEIGIPFDFGYRPEPTKGSRFRAQCGKTEAFSADPVSAVLAAVAGFLRDEEMLLAQADKVAGEVRERLARTELALPGVRAHTPLADGTCGLCGERHAGSATDAMMQALATIFGKALSQAKVVVRKNDDDDEDKGN